VRPYSVIAVVACFTFVVGCESRPPVSDSVVLPAEATVGDMVSLWMEQAPDTLPKGLVWDSEAEHVAGRSLGLSEPMVLQVSSVPRVAHALLLWADLVVVTGPAEKTLYLVHLAHSDQGVRVDSDSLLDGELADAAYVTVTRTCPGEGTAYAGIINLATAMDVKCSGREELVLTGAAGRLKELLRTIAAF